ncbi:carbon-nitrogen hydrolase family protein [Kitasatospora sp. GAS1066B]|uniref:carbon-nitrogen hydrolase family protein n=1 Tax=Kitasatospora sp. GAS1066B TaxID=3156271 RepID=UPI0035171A2F
MADRIRIAVAQTPVTCDPSANGEAVRELMGQARDAGARLVHFPEGAISGYPSGAEAKEALAGWRIDWESVRDQLELTAESAADLGLWVVVGAGHQLTPPNRPHNSLYVISDEGRLIGRYDKRRCSHTEITGWYSPGFAPLTFDIDGFRFGCTLCIEVNFPELFIEYRELGVDCVLFSSFSEDPVFDVLARGHAASQTFWISASVPAQCSAAMAAGVIGPHGSWLDRCPADGTTAMVCVDLDRTDPSLDVALNKAGPWRELARAGQIYEARRVVDPRSADRTRF